MNTEGSGSNKVIHFQVADVNKALLSITKTADMGYGCLLGNQGGYLIDTLNGEKIPIDAGAICM